MAAHQISKFVDTLVTRQAYEEMKADADEFTKIKSEDEYPKFIQERGFREEGSEGDVTPEEIEEFKGVEIPRLKRFVQDNISYEEWKEETAAELNKIANKHVPIMDAVINDLGPIDFVFAIFGILSAYKIALGGDD